MRHEHSQANKILVLHATAPTCWWSWGYEAVINRLRLVYGDQIEIRIWTAFVYENFDEHLKHYEMTWQDYLNWAKEGVDIMKVPLETNLKREKMSKTVFPATVAFFAALKQDHKKAERLSREFMRLSNVEFKDVSDNKVIFQAAEVAGLDVKQFKKDFADKKGRVKDLEEQQKTMPHGLPIYFYNMIIADGRKKYINIDHAFEPKEVEAAIDYLSGGKLKKNSVNPNDIPKYLQQHGLAPTIEVARVFGISEKEAAEKLAAWEKQGKIEKKILAGAAHWMVK